MPNDIKARLALDRSNSWVWEKKRINDVIDPTETQLHVLSDASVKCMGLADRRR